jgi:glutamyl-Q tRNA(Asp) synthetase
MTPATATSPEVLVTRFAPSPTGLLHLGHAHAALFAARAAQQAGGRLLLRIEDIDQGRCRPEYEAAIVEDLRWLGLEWEEPVVRQSDRFALYRRALDALSDRGLLYPCFCTRKEIQREISGAGQAPHGRPIQGGAFVGPDGPLYPGTCKILRDAERRAQIAAGRAYALRLDVAAATAAVASAGPLIWIEHGRGLAGAAVPAEPEMHGDVVLARKDVPASYHLAVTLDDAEQGVTLVTRGEDLAPATHIHRLLQALLDLPVPTWHHHPLIADAAGRRLAKRHDAQSIRALRDQGLSPAEVRTLAGFPDA